MSEDTQFAGYRLYGVTGALLSLVGLAVFSVYAVKLLLGTDGLPGIGEQGHYLAATGAAMIVALGMALRRAGRNIDAAKLLAVPVGVGFGLWALMRLLVAAYSPEMSTAAGPLLYVEVILFSVLSATFVLAQRNEKGAFRKNFMSLNKGVLSTYSYVFIWVSILMLSNGVAPAVLLIWEAMSPGATGLTGVAAPVMLTAFLLGPIIGAAVYPFTGMSRLMGLMHAPWLIAALVLYQQTNVGGVWQTPETIFDYWVYAALTTAILSLAIDILDVVRYAMGDKNPLWEVPSAT
jgi:hypothetical protein